MGIDTPPEAELEVLALLTKEARLTASQLRERLSKSRPLSHSAIGTLLTRLMDRGLVTRRKAKVGKAFVYQAASKGKRIQGTMIRNLANLLFEGDPKAVVASLFENRAPSSEELDELQTLLISLRKKQRPGSDRDVDNSSTE